MATFNLVEGSAADRLVKTPSKGFDAREPYRAMLAGLNGKPIEITPDETDTLRKIKMNLTLAAKEVGKEVEYGVTNDGTVLVWTKAPKVTKAK